MKTIDQHLREQEQLEASILATIEPVPDDSELVRVTPWRGGRGDCEAGLRLRKNDLEVEATPITAPCCGKELRVFRVRFQRGAQIPATELVRHLQAAKVDACDCEGMEDLLESLQGSLQTAPPAEKPVIIRQIKLVESRMARCGC